MPALILAVLACALGYAVLQSGGVERAGWNLSLLAIGALAVFYWLRASRHELAPPLERALRWPLLLLPAYVLFQVLPLPRLLLKVLSPARAELAGATAAVLPAARFAPLSVAPAVTLDHLFRICGYVAVFLLVREAAWRLAKRRWALAFPFVAIAALEAVLGLEQYYGGAPGGITRGTYVNRNHFAGFLELAFPFALMYPVALLWRVDRRFHLPVRLAAQACAGLAVAALVFLGILHSLSRMGVLACLGGLFLMVVVALLPRLPARRRQRWLVVGSVAVLISAMFVFLPPDSFVQRFTTLHSAEEIPAGTRRLIWSETLRLVAAFPAFGCGAGAYESAFLRYKVSAPLNTVDYAHNDYLQFLAELGVIGFVIGLVGLIALLRKTVRDLTAATRPDARFLAIACLGAFASILLHSLVDFNLYIPANALLLAWISGIAARCEVGPEASAEIWKALRVPPVVEAKVVK